uniref:Uncharacterized protein n=1 Tax=Hildenbrandia rubra TaxID=31481 RepID=A0A1C9CG15_9FLOR|nr:hypothetical protein Hrub_094 [Hildenbrandia rubra]AOM67338.1 hypothetical protein Hrub_094 [Hildenbrandia rubra]
MSEMNSNTAKLQKLLISNIESVNLNNDKDLNHYLNDNKVIKNIVRQYWKEYIYITPYNLASSRFEDLILRSYLLQNANFTNKNKVYIDVKKYLADEKIKVFYLNNFISIEKQLPVKYISRKHGNRLYQNALNLSKSLLKKSPLKYQRNDFVALLNAQKFPVFIIVNGAHEMIIGEPEHTIKTQKTFLDSVQYTTGIQGGYQLPLREGYIFINPLDALEYYYYLQSQYPYSFNEMKVKIFVGTLKDFYKQSRVHIDNIQLRLLPDLKEVGKLVTAYQYNSNIHFNSKQVYGKNYFQGQPIYLIDPIMCIYIDKLTGKVSKRYFPNLLALDKKEYYNIFTTYKDALSVWKQYRKKFHQYILPRQPKLTIYNLESFLKEYQASISTIEKPDKLFSLVPSYEVYQYIKSIQQPKNSRLLKDISFSAQLLVLIKMWTNRILWGMVKWYPPEQ